MVSKSIKPVLEFLMQAVNYLRRRVSAHSGSSRVVLFIALLSIFLLTETAWWAIVWAVSLAAAFCWLTPRSTEVKYFNTSILILVLVFGIVYAVNPQGKIDLSSKLLKIVSLVLIAREGFEGLERAKKKELDASHLEDFYADAGRANICCLIAVLISALFLFPQTKTTLAGFFNDELWVVMISAAISMSPIAVYGYHNWKAMKHLERERKKSTYFYEINNKFYRYVNAPSLAGFGLIAVAAVCLKSLHSSSAEVEAFVSGATAMVIFYALLTTMHIENEMEHFGISSSG